MEKPLRLEDEMRVELMSLAGRRLIGSGCELCVGTTEGKKKRRGAERRTGGTPSVRPVRPGPFAVPRRASV